MNSANSTNFPSPPAATTIAVKMPIVDYRFSCDDDSRHDVDERNSQLDDGDDNSRDVTFPIESSVLGNLTTADDENAHHSDLVSLTTVLYCPNATHSSTLQRDGVRSTKQLTSTMTVNELIPLFVNKDPSIPSGIALEVWFTPYINSTADDETEAKSSSKQPPRPNIVNPIVSISKQSNGAGEDYESVAKTTTATTTDTYDFCDGLQFALLQRGLDRLELRYKDWYDSSTYICRVLAIPNLQLQHGKLHQVMVVWTGAGGNLQQLQQQQQLYESSQLELFVNGTSVLSIPQTQSSPVSFASVDLWDPEYRLHAFADPALSASAVFPGTIHQISLYNATLEDADVTKLFQEGAREREELKDDTVIDDGDSESNDDNIETRDDNDINEDNNDKRDADSDSDDDTFTFDPSRSLQLIASSLPAGSSSVVQGRSTSVNLGGDFNMSTMFWDVAVEIIKLPEYGDLVSFHDGLKIRDVGRRIALVGEQTRTLLRYQHRSSNNFFSVPTCSWNGSRLPTTEMPMETISFRLVALNSSNPSHIFGTSMIVEQEVQIIHRNHRPTILAPPEVLLPEQQSSSFGDRPFAFLEGVSIDDPMDYDIDRIRVDVHAKNGTVSILDEDLLALADFDGCSHRQPMDINGDFVSLDAPEAWFCQGDGSRDQIMTFIATPGDASRLLSRVRYDAFRWGQGGAIDLTVYDGSGGSCLLESEHVKGRMNTTNYRTIHDECFKVHQRIVVPAVQRPVSMQDTGVGGQTVFLAILLSVIFGCLGFCCCCACLGYVVQRRVRAAPIEVMKTAADRGHVLHDLEGLPV